MPNHVSNSLQIKGPDSAAFFAAVTTGPTDSFIDTLIPLPEALRGISTGACQIDGERVTEWRDGPDGKPVRISDIDRQIAVDLHGTIDWYEWSIRHYGSKWPSYEVNVNEDTGTIHFDSAWSPPMTAVETIARMFPKATFQLSYAEGGASYYGQATWVGGTCIDQWDREDFWKPVATDDYDEDADLMDGLTGACREFLETHSLHTGG